MKCLPNGKISASIPLGIIYRNDSRKTFEELQPVWEKDDTPLYRREVDMEALRDLILSHGI